MVKDLTNSNIDRQNILNNDYAIVEIEKATKIKGIPFEGRTVVLKEQVAEFFGVTTRTIEDYIEKHNEELTKNGYVVLSGNSLKNLKNIILEQNDPEVDFGNIKMAPKIGIFDFKAFLNIAMLLSDSEEAKLLRQTMLEIVMDTINKRAGGSTKYINQREDGFVISLFQNETYRKEFTDALKKYVDMGNFKYPNYTNKVYHAIFKEHADEYREILKLTKNENIRDTMYSEVLDIISSFECGFADYLKEAFEEKGRKLNNWETDFLFEKFAKQAHWKPLIEKARMKMASRDLTFRDALHKNLEEYIAPLQRADFEKFIGDKSKELSEQLEESKEVMKRLKK